jgi:hypothetical protein
MDSVNPRINVILLVLALAICLSFVATIHPTALSRETSGLGGSAKSPALSATNGTSVSNTSSLVNNPILEFKPSGQSMTITIFVSNWNGTISASVTDPFGVARSITATLGLNGETVFNFTANTNDPAGNYKIMISTQGNFSGTVDGMVTFGGIPTSSVPPATRSG